VYPYIQLKEAAFSSSKDAIFINIENKFLNKFQVRNVFGVIKAKKETDKTIIISAHYDHLGRMGAIPTSPELMTMQVEMECFFL
jgi:hypothetical protein